MKYDSYIVILSCKVASICYIICWIYKITFLEYSWPWIILNSIKKALPGSINRLLHERKWRKRCAWCIHSHIFITPQYSRKIKYSLELPPEHRIVEPHILRICPSEVVELGRHVDTDISPVPWLDLVPIYCFALLVTLCPAIEVRVCLEPGDISLVARVGLELLLSARIEEVDRESELMLAVSWRSAE